MMSAGTAASEVSSAADRPGTAGSAARRRATMARPPARPPDRGASPAACARRGGDGHQPLDARSWPAGTWKRRGRASGVGATMSRSSASTAMPRAPPAARTVSSGSVSGAAGSQAQPFQLAVAGPDDALHAADVADRDRAAEQVALAQAHLHAARACGHPAALQRARMAVRRDPRPPAAAQAHHQPPSSRRPHQPGRPASAASVGHGQRLQLRRQRVPRQGGPGRPRHPRRRPGCAGPRPGSATARGRRGGRRGRAAASPPRGAGRCGCARRPAPARCRHPPARSGWHAPASAAHRAGSPPPWRTGHAARHRAPGPGRRRAGCGAAGHRLAPRRRSGRCPSPPVSPPGRPAGPGR